MQIITIIDMKRLLVFIIAVLFMAGCELLTYTINSPTCLRIDGITYRSTIENVPTHYSVPAGITVKDQMSFFFSYHRCLNAGSRAVSIQFDVLCDEAFEMNRRYSIANTDQNYMTYISDDEAVYYLKEGWIVFHDIEKGHPNTVFLSGSFEFTAQTQDGAKTISVSDGTFESVEAHYGFVKQEDTAWYER